MCIITSNCGQIWHPDQPMGFIVSSIVGGLNEQNSMWINVCADDWTAEMSTITSNVLVRFGIKIRNYNWESFSPPASTYPKQSQGKLVVKRLSWTISIWRSFDRNSTCPNRCIQIPDLKTCIYPVGRSLNFDLSVKSLQWVSVRIFFILQKLFNKNAFQ